MKRLHAVVGIVFILAGLRLPLAPGLDARARGDDEMERHIEDLRRQVEDPTTSIERREQRALELAATLDRLGQSAPSADARRARWTEAIEVLDRFETQNPGHPRSREHQFQAAVYLWARARSWLQQAELEPTHKSARADAIKDLDAALVRLRAVPAEEKPDDNDLLGQNLRYRIAQVLADRTELEPEGTPDRRQREEEALTMLERPITEPALRGYALLLRAALLGRLGRFEPAEEALNAAWRTRPSPPPADLLAARVEILAGRKRFGEALQAIDTSALDELTKNALAVHLLLVQHARTVRVDEQSAIQTALFRRVAALRASGSPALRGVLLELARRLVEPDPNQDPEAFEAVAEGALALGELVRASRLEVRAAARAQALGRAEEAARHRLRAGAYLYQAEQYAEADSLLTQVFENPSAGAARPTAGMLRALARNRALALRRPEASRKAYVDALEAQIRTFPDESVTNEARWLLGRLRLASADKDAAKALWTAIRPGAPRWVDARLEMARLAQHELDTLRISNDRPQIQARYDEARSFLTESLEQAGSPQEKPELELALARLELTPLVGEPEQARQRCEQLLRSASRTDQRDAARRLQIVALAELNRFDEAEARARDEANRSPVVDLMATARLLDHIGSDSESDLRMRRFGLIIRTLLAAAPERSDALTEEQMSELRLRNCRALLFRGDEEGARRSLTAWNGQVPHDDHGFLRDLGDTYFRLEAYAMAIDVERLRQQRLATGSLPWFESRYRLALAEYRAGKAKDALHLIDATAILHPDLGGAELHDKFIRLRQRIGPDH